MARARDDHAHILQSFRFAGYASGLVKTLSGFKKSHHSVPDAVTPATSAFLFKLSADELAAEGEQMFQNSRRLLGYKRTELSLDVNQGDAVLSAKDFVYEIGYALRDEDPGEYLVTRSLHSLRSSHFLHTAECDELFEGLFTQVVFVLQKGAPVERVIDAVEGLGRDSALSVDYPSDYAYCTLRVPDVEAEVHFDGQELAMRFPRSAPPQTLWKDFLAVRHAFALTKESTLAALITG